MKPRYSAILFDLDGTLIDSAEDLTTAVNFTLNKLGHRTYSREEVEDMVGDGLETLLRRALENPDEATLQKSIEIFEPFYQANCVVQTQVYEGVEKILTQFAEIPKAIVSNKPYAMTDLTLKELRLHHFFKVILGGDSLTEKKPHPLPVQVALERLGVSAQSALLVGDSAPDVDAARAAGIAVCACTYGFRRRADLEKLNPDFLIDSIDELSKIVLS